MPTPTPAPSTVRRIAAPYVESAFVHGSADRNAVLRAVFANNAPLHVVRTLSELPRQYYFNLDELTQELDRVTD